jgi:hypothetical protein
MINIYIFVSDGVYVQAALWNFDFRWCLYEGLIGLFQKPQNRDHYHDG